MSIQLRYVYKKELYEKIGFYKMLTVITLMCVLYDMPLPKIIITLKKLSLP